MSDTSVTMETVKREVPVINGVEMPVINDRLEGKGAVERMEWAVEAFPQQVVLSSSFGAQAAVSLHMATRIWADIPVILIDTGYLFPETYRFVDEMVEGLGLNLKVYQPRLSTAWQEARYGKLWEEGVEGLTQYGKMNKDEPLQRALAELKPKAWLAGLRRQQSGSRKKLNVLGFQHGVVKVHPIVDWTDKQIFEYLKANDLPYHPLWHEGYVSIGDVHTTRPVGDDVSEEEARFFGLKRECGLHDDAKTMEDMDYSI